MKGGSAINANAASQVSENCLLDLNIIHTLVAPSQNSKSAQLYTLTVVKILNTFICKLLDTGSALDEMEPETLSVVVL